MLWCCDNMAFCSAKYSSHLSWNVLFRNGDRKKKDVVEDGILRLRCRPRRTKRNVRAIFDSDPFAPLCQNMASSTKTEVHNISQRRQKRPEPRPLVTCSENLVKFGRMVFEICKRTERQTNRHTNMLIAILRTPTGGEVTKSKRLNPGLLHLENLCVYRTYYLCSLSLGPSTPATMSKQRSTLSKQHSTLSKESFDL